MRSPLPDGAAGSPSAPVSAPASALASRLPRLACVDAEALPHAADVARLAARFAAKRGAGTLEPAYLRNQVALTLVEQQALRASR